MAANLNVTYQEMEDAGSRLAAGQQEITSRLDDLRRQIAALVSAGYVTDRSSKQFEQAYADFDRGATAVIGGLSGMSNYLKAAALTFRNADEELARQISR